MSAITVRLRPTVSELHTRENRMQNKCSPQCKPENHVCGVRELLGTLAVALIIPKITRLYQCHRILKKIQ
ncbi:hypothetical protein CJF30_00011315 [Rutstroemia sp. NJR-2017a BBW]|nr:hypothetical protein CJF30_00011315 [Rutstroemia sp. NJR-2017a BBW]